MSPTRSSPKAPPTFSPPSPADLIPAVEAWFLGPKGENADLLSSLVNAALQTHTGWRRRFHPEDPSPITDQEKATPAFNRHVARLRSAFSELLSRLDGSVPAFSGRYIGHMLSEQTIASQAAYFATMLYNPNNVSLEVSPVTTQLEAEVADQLAGMIGYDPLRCWGHLTSGGTVANFEALWIARNILYHPVAAASVARELGLSVDARLPDGTVTDLASLQLWDLLNLRPACSLDLWDALWAAAPRDVISEALRERSLATLGYQDYSRRLAEEFGDPLPAGVVLAGATAHYSWEKIVRALGIGGNQLISLPVDAECRIDPDALWDRVVALSARRIPVMACIAVCGTTEEGAIDPLSDILSVRSRAERELGVTFHIHSDACYGGYAASITRSLDGSRRTAREIRTALKSEWPSDRWVRDLCALENADSVTIDPHKLGYVPYPSGAFLLKDRRGRELVATDPPYLASTEPNAATPSIGRFIFEGSKPGAAAAAVWLSQKTIPLNGTGYGALIASTILSAQRLRTELVSGALDQFDPVCLPGGDLNIVCFVVTHPAFDTLESINALNEGVYAALRGGAHPQPEYMITRTRLFSPGYDETIAWLLPRLGSGVSSDWTTDSSRGLVVLRATVMNPFSGSARSNHIKGFADALRRAAERVAATLL